ncbi:MAG: hypothetical protein O6913_00805 [Chloroflexi bacterium]|nr:hypothetical protein [Chloroflexota bacterium]
MDRLREAGLIDLPTVQRYLNQHYTVSLDLFGREISTNAATYFAAGLKGRYQEARLRDDHDLRDASWDVLGLEDGAIVRSTHPARNALNDRLRLDYTRDCQRGVDRWNETIRAAGVEFELRLPHVGFSREIGAFAGARMSPEGVLLSEAEWEASCGEWLLSAEDEAFVASLMGRVVEPGKMASWIAPPARGINRKPAEFEYVRFN